ncbi:MAG: dual specificity protein phosphatase, partial [Chloroflexota bacterium]
QLIPARVRFSNVIWIQKSGLFAQLENVPFDHPVRSIRGMLHWTLPQQKPRFMLLHGEEDFSMLMFYADSYAREDRSGIIEPLSESRYWAAAPLLEDATVEGNQELYDQYGGDSVPIWIDGAFVGDRLFVGGVDEQAEKRPLIDHVLNLGEKPSRWQKGDPSAQDRWSQQGEGSQGMTPRQIYQEAKWVVDHLKKDKRVLVHCVAGFNRSVTICCAILMILEKIPPTTALQRIRRNHPWARPDGTHWLALKYLAQRQVK